MATTAFLHTDASGVPLPDVAPIHVGDELFCFLEKHISVTRDALVKDLLLILDTCKEKFPPLAQHEIDHCCQALLQCEDDRVAPAFYTFSQPQEILNVLDKLENKYARQVRFECDPARDRDVGQEPAKRRKRPLPVGMLGDDVYRFLMGDIVYKNRVKQDWLDVKKAVMPLWNIIKGRDDNNMALEKVMSELNKGRPAQVSDEDLFHFPDNAPEQLRFIKEPLTPGHTLGPLALLAFNALADAGGRLRLNVQAPRTQFESTVPSPSQGESSSPSPAEQEEKGKGKDAVTEKGEQDVSPTEPKLRAPLQARIKAETLNRFTPFIQEVMGGMNERHTSNFWGALLYPPRPLTLPIQKTNSFDLDTAAFVEYLHGWVTTNPADDAQINLWQTPLWQNQAAWDAGRSFMQPPLIAAVEAAHNRWIVQDQGLTYLVPHLEQLMVTKNSGVRTLFVKLVCLIMTQSMLRNPRQYVNITKTQQVLERDMLHLMEQIKTIQVNWQGELFLSKETSYRVQEESLFSDLY